ncbi:MAG: RNA methyltransferase [Bdellovibrionales bacterium]|nr:RNA methyltransferase [Oligoflexia bacterium]
MAKTTHITAAVLLHYPVTSRAGEPITTAITNLDIHDIARSTRTYEIDHYYLVNPIAEQVTAAKRILAHWETPRSKEWHPDRFEALSRVKILPDFDDVKADLATLYPGLRQEVAMPDARTLPNQFTYPEIRAKWESESEVSVKIIVFGTGGGISSAFYPEVHTYLAPVYGPLESSGYNHLSVRAAAAIILDRLYGK